MFPILGGSLKAGAFTLADCSYGFEIPNRATHILLVLRILLYQRGFEVIEEGRDQGLSMENLLNHIGLKTPSIPQIGLGFHNPFQKLLGSCNGTLLYSRSAGALLVFSNFHMYSIGIA